MHGINSVRCLIEVIRLKEYYVTVSAPQLLRRILLIPLGLVALASAIVCFSSIDKLTPSYIVPDMFMYFGAVLLLILRYGKVYQRIRMDEIGVHSGKVTIRWEEVEAYHLEEIAFWYNSFWKYRSTVVRINGEEKDRFRSHTRNCLYFPLNHKTLNAIRFYQKNRSDAMTDLTEKYISVIDN